jgi:nitrate reductase NapAB chaperone NapD
MNLSGILVTADPAQLSGVLQGLAVFPGMEVRQVDAAKGRIVVVQEAGDVGAEMNGFMQIRALPGVVNVDLVCHYFGDEEPAHDSPASATPFDSRHPRKPP